MAKKSKIAKEKKIEARLSIITLPCKLYRGMPHPFARTVAMNLMVGRMRTCANSKCLV